MSTSIADHPDSSADNSLSASRNLIQSVKAKADAKRTRSELVADWLTEKFGTMTFLLLNFAWFTVWIVLNIRIIPGLQPFDPFPFTFLTMVVSLEAIGLAIVVLMSQNRASKIADLREEVDLQVDTTTEAELTKLLYMVRLLLDKNGIDLSDDEELRDMLQPTDLEKLEEVLEGQVMAGDNQALKKREKSSG